MMCHTPISSGLTDIAMSHPRSFREAVALEKMLSGNDDHGCSISTSNTIYLELGLECHDNRLSIVSSPSQLALSALDGRQTTRSILLPRLDDRAIIRSSTVAASLHAALLSESTLSATPIAQHVFVRQNKNHIHDKFECGGLARYPLQLMMRQQQTQQKGLCRHPPGAQDGSDSFDPPQIPRLVDSVTPKSWACCWFSYAVWCITLN